MFGGQVSTEMHELQKDILKKTGISTEGRIKSNIHIIYMYYSETEQLIILSPMQSEKLLVKLGSQKWKVTLVQLITLELSKL